MYTYTYIYIQTICVSIYQLAYLLPPAYLSIHLSVYLYMRTHVGLYNRPTGPRSVSH